MGKQPPPAQRERSESFRVSARIVTDRCEHRVSNGVGCAADDREQFQHTIRTESGIERIDREL